MLSWTVERAVGGQEFSTLPEAAVPEPGAVPSTHSWAGEGGRGGIGGTDDGRCLRLTCSPFTFLLNALALFTSFLQLMAICLSALSREENLTWAPTERAAVCRQPCGTWVFWAATRVLITRAFAVKGHVHLPDGCGPPAQSVACLPDVRGDRLRPFVMMWMEMVIHVDNSALSAGGPSPGSQSQVCGRCQLGPQLCPRLLVRGLGNEAGHSALCERGRAHRQGSGSCARVGGGLCEALSSNLQ